MNHQAKASSAGSVSAGASARDLPSLLALISAFALILTLALSGQASASEVYKFKETFGSAAHPTFASPMALAVDQSSGDLLVMDVGSDNISRFKPDGSPADFSALGTNVIDGAGGADETPQKGLPFFQSAGGSQIAVDNSGTLTDGNIYVTISSPGTPSLIDIFASSGAYLGQLTESEGNPFKEACGVAVDSDGDVYVGDYTGEIHKFSPAANPPTNANFITNLNAPPSTCTLAAGIGSTAGSLFPASFVGELFKQNATSGHFDYTVSTGSTTTEAVAPGSGHVFAASEQEVHEFDASGSSNAVPVAKLIAQSRVLGVAVDLSGDVYVSRSGSSEIEVFGTPVNLPTVTPAAATNVTGTKATLNGTVNPEGVEVTECFFEYGLTSAYGSKTTSCEGATPTDSEAHAVSAKVSGLSPNGVTYHYRLVAKNENGEEKSADRTLVTANTVFTAAATAISKGGATLHGMVHPEGTPFSDCKFEYGLTSNAGFEEEAPCNPSATDIAPDFAAHDVSAAVAGLQTGTTYKFRLVATNADGTTDGEVVTFTTSGPPVISEVRALDASQGAATIEGKINPSGFGTSYHFEWGPTPSYGNQVPAEFEPFIGSGSEPVRVSANLSGLTAGTTYHYRIVASSSAGTTATPDQMLETLNSCGLPEGRCFELVSRREAGPVVIPGETLAEVEMHYQAATSGPGGLAYVTEAGYPEATKGAEVLYRGTRGPGGWQSTQLSPPIITLNEQVGVGSSPGKILWLSNDLSCGFAESTQPLTEDPSMRLVRESGGTNLYRINSDGSYTPVSYLAPENPEVATGSFNYSVAGASQDCTKVLFTSELRYPGVTGVGAERFYEWDEGTLRNARVVPGPSGEVAVETILSVENNSLNTVSEDGSRVFFSARRQTSPNPAEVGKTAVFVREDGTTTRDLSLSETSTPDEGATYQWATPDGSRVFFTANAGLTDESSPEGTDLYEYDLESEELTDLTPYQGEGGAGVAGFIGVAEDGSRAYFASANQLVPGKGPTLAENQNEETLSIYGASNGEFSWVGTFAEADFQSVVLNNQSLWTSQVSPDGRYLLFESSTNVTGYDSGGPPEAYLYDANDGSNGTTCVSCRQDGQPSVAPVYHIENGKQIVGYEVLPRARMNNQLHPAQFLTMHGGEPQVFFSSPDKLAPGAVEHQNNVYEWSHGQVFRLVSAREGQQAYPKAGFFAVFAGAGEDGSHVYLVTPETLNWEDGDERLSIYDARVGGGSPEPPPPPAACEATTEGSCQAPPQGGPSVPGAASAAFSGPGNPVPAGGKQKKSHKKKHAKKKHRRHTKRGRHANANRRAGK